MGRRLGAGIAALAVAVALGGCSLGEKQAIADRATAARDAGDAPRVAVVQLAIRPLDLPEGVAVTPDSPAAAGGAYAMGVGTVQSRSGRSTMLAPPAAAARIAALSGTAPDEPSVLLFADRAETVVRRPAREVAAARAWYRLELERVKEVSKPDAVGALTDRAPSDVAVLTPTLMVDLLAGVLPGSVEQNGRVITGRLSIDKANREDDLDDDAVDARREAFRLFAVTEDVHEFTLDLRDDGGIDALEVRMRMRPNKQTRIALTWSMDVQDEVLEIDRPPDDASIRISSYNQVRGAIAAWTAVA